jgi:thioredoxin 1
MTIRLNDLNFEREVLRSSDPVLVDFYGDFCKPCMMIAPLIEELAAELIGKAVVGKVNVTENPGLAAAYQIGAVPTFLIFKNGRVAESLIGVQSKSRLLKAIGIQP